MASDLRVQRVMPPYLGLDTDSAPEMVSPEKAPNHQNWLLDRPGKCVMRGPFRKLNGGVHTATPTSQVLLGQAAFDDVVAWYYADGHAGGRVAPWESFWKVAATDTELLFAPNATDLYQFSALSSGTETSTNTVTARDTPWGNGSRLGSRIAFPAIESGVVGEAVGPGGGLRKATILTSWTGGTAGANTGPPGGAGLADSPNFCIGVRSHYSRWFICAARDPGAAFGNVINFSGAGVPGTYNPHQIYWTNPTADGALTGTYTDWRNANTLALNKLTVGQQDLGDACMGIAKVERNLLILKRNSCFVLYGYSEDTWAVRQVSSDLGCLDPRSIVEYQDGVFFMSGRGFFFYDGTVFREVTSTMRSSILRLALLRVGPSGTDGGFVKANRMPNGYIHLSIGVQNYDTGAISIDWNGYYYPPTDSWSSLVVDTAIMPNGGPFGFLSSPNYFLAYSGENYWQAPDIFQPENIAAGDYGWDRHPTAAGTKAATVPNFRTKLYQLASPIWTSQLHKLLVDYHYVLTTGVDDAEAAWTVALSNGANETLLPVTNIPATGASSNHLSRRRKTLDVYTMTNNAADLSVVLARGGPNSVSRAEVYGIDVQYQVAQERRSQ